MGSKGLVKYKACGYAYSDAMVEDAEPLASGVTAGHRYKVIQTEVGNFCGYVKTNFGPRWSYDEIRGHMSNLIRIHGGLTYGVDENGWVGFDCAHSGDVCKLDGEIQVDYSMSGGATVWDVDDVEEECRKLAQQVDVLETFAERFDKRGWGNDD